MSDKETKVTLSDNKGPT